MIHHWNDIYIIFNDETLKYFLYCQERDEDGNITVSIKQCPGGPSQHNKTKKKKINVVKEDTDGQQNHCLRGVCTPTAALFHSQGVETIWVSVHR